MRVFKACLLVIKCRMVMFATYFFIFISLSILLSQFSSEDHTGGFEESRPTFTVINRDKETPYTEKMMDFLKAHGTWVPLKDDKEALQDARFNDAVSYILIIPEGFQDALQSEKPVKLLENMTQDSASGYQMSSYVNQYWEYIRTWEKIEGKPDREKTADEVLKLLSSSVKVEKRQYLKTQPVSQGYGAQYQVAPYIILVICVLCITSIFLSFQRPDIRMRNLCGPLKPFTRLWQMGLGCACVGIVFWILLTLAGFVIYYDSVKNMDIRITALILLNSFIMLLFAMAVSVLASLFVKDSNTQNAAANILALGLSFLGGAFVPTSIMGESVLKFAKCLPVYWYEECLSKISGLTGFGMENLLPVWKCMGILLGFTAAVLCVTLAVNKHRSGAEESFGSNKTEIEW